MSAAPQRLRSLLFVPAHIDRFVARAHERSADAVVLDLEDAVPAAAKDTARAALADALGRVTQCGARAAVRVNHNLLDLARDLDAAVRPGLFALVLPKVESASWIVEIADAVAMLEAQRGMPAGRVRLLLQIETPSALPHLDAIARAHPRVLAMTLGPEDFCASLGGAPCDDLLLGPNLQVLCAALLTDEPVTYTNVPDIVDVNLLLELLSDMGVRVEQPQRGTVILQADKSIDFRVIKKVMFSCAQAGYSNISFAVNRVGGE